MSALANPFLKSEDVHRCPCLFVAFLGGAVVPSLAFVCWVCGGVSFWCSCWCVLAVVVGAPALVLFSFFAFAFRRGFVWVERRHLCRASHSNFSIMFYILVDLICIVSELQLLVRSAWTDFTRLTRVWCNKKKNQPRKQQQQ